MRPLTSTEVIALSCQPLAAHSLRIDSSLPADILPPMSPSRICTTLYSYPMHRAYAVQRAAGPRSAPRERDDGRRGMRRWRAPGIPRRRGAGRSEVPALVLLALDGLEERLEVALAEAERAVTLDDLEEDRRAVAERLGEDLQEVAVLVAVDEDL